ncbi:MAG: GGDEF domain-containing protein, partial [Lachnospiraceae bacterium]|nr:GGDEF domain-containing protein [Lachnospiraceae bacterium]
WNYFINNEMAPFQKLASTGGFCTGGELNRDHHTGRIMWHNITMLTIGMREGDMTGNKRDPVEVDAARLHGQASLVRRLTTLVQVTADELRQSLDELAETNKKLLYMATVDELTALFNRREIERRINAALDEAAKEGRQVALIMMDVDHFKAVNDNYGHETGDKILEGVASVLNATVQEWKGEAVGRWGGEEFFMLLPQSTLEEAVETAEEIRATIEQYPFPKVEKLTCSLGVTMGSSTEDRKKVYARVDNALYEAKETGRNKVVVAD